MRTAPPSMWGIGRMRRKRRRRKTPRPYQRVRTAFMGFCLLLCGVGGGGCRGRNASLRGNDPSSWGLYLCTLMGFEGEIFDAHVRTDYNGFGRSFVLYRVSTTHLYDHVAWCLV